MRFLFILAMIVAITPLRAENPSFYAFQNGVRLSSDDKRADLLGELGYDGIGSARLPADGDLEQLFATYEARNLRVFSFYVGITVTAEGVETPANLLGLIPLMNGSDVVLELYVRGDRSLPEETVAEAVQEIADLAAEAEVSVVLYPHSGFRVATLSEAVALARVMDRENVGVMFNLCHFLRVEPEADLREELEAAGPLLRQVSISGAEVGGTDWKALIQPLGQGTYDVGRVMTLLDELGFAGPVGLQCYNIEGKSADFLKQSMAAWKAMH